MSAVKESVHLCEFLRRLNDNSFFFLGMLSLTFHHVESCNNKVGIAVKQFLVSVEDIEDTVVSAARKQPALAVLCDYKALLVAEIVLDFFAVFYTRQLFVLLWITTPAGDTTEQE